MSIEGWCFFRQSEGHLNEYDIGYLSVWIEIAANVVSDKSTLPVIIVVFNIDDKV